MTKNKFDLPNYRKNELSDLAEFIADEYFYDSLICPYKLLKIYGITYSFADYGNAFDGLLEYRAGKFHVYLNSHSVKHKYVPRVRFTLAHELGHYVIDEHRNALKKRLVSPHPSFTNFASDNEAELEADFFASSLLLPKARLLNDIYKRKFSFNLIEEIAAKYQTSIAATLIKFASIGNHPIMIICTINRQIKWFKYSEDFPFKYINYTGAFLVPHNTAAGEYFYENGIKSTEDEIVFAQDWFRIGDRNDYGRKFYEHCIYSDKNDFVLSVIWED
ncbi:ImmA/IrrE family metallo-endopeptidase [Proteiniphilum sp.]|uniref:ImmA/IrrE family metallo-endopeptidase n=1 Tax=Proteiniphilum sp. TaxID=1926877 RepID=UPI0033222083